MGSDVEYEDEEAGVKAGDVSDEAESEIVDALSLMRVAAGILDSSLTSARRDRFDRWRGASVKWRVRLVLTMTGQSESTPQRRECGSSQ